MKLRLATAIMTTVIISMAGVATPAQVEMLPVSQIEPGMEGVGFTVFSGNKIDSFKVHILGVMYKYGPKQDLILAKLEGGPLAETGVVQGMSGSPVYIDDKLIGAVAFSFPFSKEPIAGITPIAETIEATSTPAPARRAARLSFPLEPEKLEAAVPARSQAIPIQGTSLTGVDLLKPYLGRQLSPITNPTSFHGFTRESLEHITPILRKLGLEALMGGAALPSGQSSEGQIDLSNVNTASVRPGDAVGVGLVTGDMNISATGTVTHVDSLTGAVYAFGHPLYNLGPIEYPMTFAEVHYVLPSVQTSFKISSTGPVVGTWRQDRLTGIKGVIGARPRMVPVNIAVKTSRGQDRKFSIEVVNDELFSPILTYASLLSVLQTTERDFGSQTVKVSALVTMDKDRRVIIDDVFAGQGSAMAASAMVAAPMSFLMTNDFEKVQIREVDVEIEASESIDTARLVRAWLDTDQVAPGGSVPLKVLLRSYRGEETLERVNIEIPSNVEEGKLRLLIADANTISAIEKRIMRSSFEPRNFSQLIRAINGLRKNNRLYVRLSRPGSGGAIVAGEYLSSLPPSVLNVLEADSSSASFIPIYSSTLWEYELATDFSVSGSRVLELTVKNP
jgi:hypothetical protein